jgi:hypothetical protein
MVKVNANEPALVLCNTLVRINPVAIEKRNLKIVKVRLLDLLHLTIVHAFVFTRNIISINLYTTILIHTSLILSFGVECVSIYVVPLISYNSEYRVTSQLFEAFTCMSIQLRNPILELANEFSHVFIC